MPSPTQNRPSRLPRGHSLPPSRNGGSQKPFASRQTTASGSLRTLRKRSRPSRSPRSPHRPIRRPPNRPCPRPARPDPRPTLPRRHPRRHRKPRVRARRLRNGGAHSRQRGRSRHLPRRRSAHHRPTHRCLRGRHSPPAAQLPRQGPVARPHRAVPAHRAVLAHQARPHRVLHRSSHQHDQHHRLPLPATPPDPSPSNRANRGAARPRRFHPQPRTASNRDIRHSPRPRTSGLFRRPLASPATGSHLSPLPPETRRPR